MLGKIGSQRGRDGEDIVVGLTTNSMDMNGQTLGGDEGLEDLACYSPKVTQVTLQSMSYKI